MVATLLAIANPEDEHSILIKHIGGDSIPASDWSYSITAGRESPTTFREGAVYGRVYGEDILSVGRVLKITETTNDINPTIEPGSYHVVLVHTPTNSILIDTNVNVPSREG